MAGWSSGRKGMGLAVSPYPYPAQIADVKSTTVTDQKTKEEKARFQWGVDVWVNGVWQRKSLFTGVNFCDLNSIRDPQFIPGLVKLVRACGLPVPQSPAEAEQWHPHTLIGQRFGIRVEEEAGLITEKYVRLEGQPQVAPVQSVQPPPAQPVQPAPYGQPVAIPQPAPMQPAAMAPQPLPQYAPATAPPAAPPAPAYAAAPAAAPYPQQYAPQPLPTPAAPAPAAQAAPAQYVPPQPPPMQGDPFQGDPGAVPVGAGTAVAAASDPWA